MSDADVAVLQAELRHLREGLTEIKKEVKGMRVVMDSIQRYQARTAGVLATIAAMAGGVGAAVGKLL